jgi:hypothetical protein
MGTASAWSTMSGNDQINTSARDATVDGAASRPREIMPMDGAIVEAGGHVAIYCATCSRWIDCHGGIPAQTALERHSSLIH